MRSETISEAEGGFLVLLLLPSQRWRVLLPAGYQGYKRHCRRGGAEDNGDALSLEDNSEKVKDIAVENGGFAYDDSSTAEEKKKDKFSSQLWDRQDPRQGFVEVSFGPKCLETRCQDDSLLHNIQDFAR